jgi:hypothetical protein
MRWGKQVAEFAESDGSRGLAGFWVGCLVVGAIYYWWRKRGALFAWGPLTVE